MTSLKMGRMENESRLELTLRDALAQARTLLGETRQVIVAAFQKDFDSRRKADQTWVTEIDLAVERLLRTRLQELFPKYGVIGEEYDQENVLAEFTWVIDPIDGTSSLRHRIPLFGTILALLYDGRPALGLIDLPMLGRLYSGGAGLGVWCNDRPLRLADIQDDSEVPSEIISLGGRGQYVSAGMQHIFDELMSRHLHVRTYGDCFGHAMALEGAAGAMVDFDLRVWDVAATQVLVGEAGGKFFCWRVRRVSPSHTRYDVIFGKPRVVDWITRTLHLG
jgi:histidinol-phosphatase